MKPKATSLDDVFAVFENDEEFKRESRLQKPYYDLVLEVIRRRKELGLTQQKLAEKSGMHQGRISKIEAAEHDLRLSTLIKIAEALESEVSISLTPIARPISVSDDPRARAFFSVGASGAAAQEVSEIKAGKFSVIPVYA